MNNMLEEIREKLENIKKGLNGFKDLSDRNFQIILEMLKDNEMLSEEDIEKSKELMR